MIAASIISGGKPHDLLQIPCGDREAGLYHQPHREREQQVPEIHGCKKSLPLGQLGTEGPVYGFRGSGKKMDQADQKLACHICTALYII